MLLEMLRALFLKISNTGIKMCLQTKKQTCFCECQYHWFLILFSDMWECFRMQVML